MNYLLKFLTLLLLPLPVFSQKNTTLPDNKEYVKLVKTLAKSVNQPLGDELDSAGYYFSIRICVSKNGKVDSVSLSKQAPSFLISRLVSKGVYADLDWNKLVGHSIIKPEVIIIPFSFYCLDPLSKGVTGKVVDVLFDFGTVNAPSAAAIPCNLIYTVSVGYYPTIR